MHRHGVYRFQLLQTAGGNPANAAGAVTAREGHPKGRFWLAGFGLIPGYTEGEADIPVHQAEVVVVAGDQHRPAGVPAVGFVDQFFSQQLLGDTLVQALHAPGAFA